MPTLSMSDVSRDAAVSVNTVKKYIHLMNMTFQCHLVMPYFENIGKRFVKSPKIFFHDTGLIKTILGEINLDSGALYESWVFSELLKWKQLEAIEPEIYSYRTSGGLEIDFLLQAGRKMLPLEVKASSRVSRSDGRQMEAFMKGHDKSATIGIVVYKGKELAEIRKDIWAVPDWFLFGGV